MPGYRALPVTLWQIDNSHACGGVVTDEDGIVVEGCPYFMKHLKGKHLAFWRKRGWMLTKVAELPIR